MKITATSRSRWWRCIRNWARKAGCRSATARIRQPFTPPGGAAVTSSDCSPIGYEIASNTFRFFCSYRLRSPLADPVVLLATAFHALRDPRRYLIIGDYWMSLDTVLGPGIQILAARSAVLPFLQRLAAEEHRQPAEQGPRRALANHTALRPAGALEGYVEELFGGSAVARRVAAGLR